MSDRPGDPYEKLMAFRRAHFEMGKAFGEAILRRTLGLAPVPNPENLPDTPERRRLIRMDDAAAKREAEDARREAEAELARQNTAKMEAVYKDQRIADLEAKLAEMQAALAGANVTVTPLAPTPAPEGVQPEGEPNESWTKQQILQFITDRGFEAPPRGGHFMSQTALLDYALDQVARAQSAA